VAGTVKATDQLSGDIIYGECRQECDHPPVLDATHPPGGGVAFEIQVKPGFVEAKTFFQKGANPREIFRRYEFDHS
jgi:hypothetical protein